MKHLKRLKTGLMFTLLLIWPFIVWMSNYQMAVAVAIIWWVTLGAAAVMYAIGTGYEAFKARKGEHGNG